MKRRFLYGVLLAALAINLFFGAEAYFSNVQAAEKDEAYPNLKLFGVVLDRIRQEYVDGDKLSYQDLIHGALKGMLSTLDPHSEFMEPAKYDDLKKDTQGEFGGVGIVVSIKDNSLTVVSPMEDTPGFKAGILTGDRIVKIDGRSTERMVLPEAVKRLRGAPGTDVTLTIFRASSSLTTNFTLTRAQIKVDTVKDINGRREFPLSEGNVSYVRLTQFGEQTASDLEDAMRKAVSKGAESLVLDLRDNPGGLLDQAVHVCEKFLPAGQLVVSTEGRDGKQKAMYHGKGRGKLPALPVVVLVNNGSASAAEIVAGCLQDCTVLGVCKAIIIGEQTFGKGSVQSILPLQDGSALRLTTAKYYTPSHKVIHEHGITPDITVPMTDEDMRDVQLKRTPGGIESLPEPDQERVRQARDAQLDRALDVLKGIALYTKRAAKPDKVAAK
ncbi:MAG TPA: S41 family peptidase [Verrucomicrobiae bacterium]|nr:S41 family peptidase [Verrucomicrobiae bacterium]